MNRLFMLSLLVFGLALAMVGPGSLVRPGTAEAAPGAEGAGVFSQQCLSADAVQVTVGWVSGYQGNQWVDMSPYDNGFAGGTFTSMGPLASNTQSVVWQGLRPNTLYFIRVNTLTPFGWMPTVNVFMTMNCQYLLGLSINNTSDTFRHSCEVANGRWDNGRCVFIRFIFDFDRDRDHDHDHDHDNDCRDRDHDFDRDRDRDCDHDNDNCDRGDFNRNGGHDCDNDNDDCRRDFNGGDRGRDCDNDDNDNCDRDDFSRGGRDCDDDDDDGPPWCQGQMMDNGRCRPPTTISN